jgi:hypothetical protein
MTEKGTLLVGPTRKVGFMMKYARRLKEDNLVGKTCKNYKSTQAINNNNEHVASKLMPIIMYITNVIIT